MKERPILFSAPMVRALLDGSKTQTRRVAKVENTMGHASISGPRQGKYSRIYLLGKEHDLREIANACPYGLPGDRLWVRETFRGCRAYEVQGYSPKNWGNKPIWYESDGQPPGNPDAWASRARPSIHMPRWASRITLEITGVRIERLNDISEEDANAEGVRHSLHLPGGRFARGNYEHLWWTIHGDGSWEANPWVWVVEFKVVKP